MKTQYFYIAGTEAVVESVFACRTKKKGYRVYLSGEGLVGHKGSMEWGTNHVSALGEMPKRITKAKAQKLINTAKKKKGKPDEHIIRSSQQRGCPTSTVNVA